MTDNVDFTTNIFALPRSDFMDAFAAIESEVCAELRRHGVTPPHSFIQRLKTLKGIGPSKDYSENRCAAVLQCLQRLESLNPIRCDIVHAPLHTVKIGGITQACFINPSKSDSMSTVARLITVRQLEAMTAELNKIVQFFRDPKPTPASSPPRPSPGGAGGP